MSDTAKFIQARHIDSFQKLHLLLFLYQHPKSSCTSQQIAEGLFLGDVPLLEEIINDLREAGLVDCFGNHCWLRDEPVIRSCIECLAAKYEHPLDRQRILDQVTPGTSFAKCRQEDAYEPH